MTVAEIDYREPQYREEVFLDFYEFHLKYRSHPGCVYYLMPHLRETYGWNEEESLWFAFINGNTQNPVASLVLHQEAPRPQDFEKLISFFNANYDKFDFDTDRRYHKKSFESAIYSYLGIVGYGQYSYWKNKTEQSFREIWNTATSIETFGRLSAFSYLEYLRIMGLDFDCDNLMLSDIAGSRSHRNGLCIVLGLDDYDWHKSNPNFDGTYEPELLEKLEINAARLLDTMRDRAKDKSYERDVSYFTLESTLCTYKSWHRPNRRYPNVYNDMLYNRIKKNEAIWTDRDLTVFWEARRKYLPDYLRLEDTPNDLGLNPIKQNHYLTTGQVIMMDRDYPKYRNDYNDKYGQTR